jgi:acetyl/propionyl-CoA carboxylase alpha subunit
MAIKRLLIANRGEIALRVARTCRSMGISPVTIYSPAEKTHPHARAGDTAYLLPGEDALAGYLDPETILDAARATGADAVHPGYGFLSESAAFAARVVDAGLCWVGPEPAVIRQLGDKDAARQLAKEHGVPVLPGYEWDDEPPEKIATEAARIGFPLLVKAVAGGGGRGMRLVSAQAQLSQALDSAGREANQGFGNGKLFLEKYLDGARHIEVQLMADRHGHVFHLFERDCSLQRRNQKVIEICPAPNLPPGTRDLLVKAALALGAAARLSNAATAEFLVSRAGEFYFLEMNCRLQVEHPVTEEVLGLDLVELQLRSAAGESLGEIAAGQRTTSGFAVESRIYAEAPGREFAPGEGKLLAADFPPDSAARIESALSAGMEISTSFDPMLAKVITAGETLDEALAANAAALSETVIAGVETNIAFLRHVLFRPEVSAGASTRMLEQWAKEYAVENSAAAGQSLAAALALAFALPGASRRSEPFAVSDGFRGMYSTHSGLTMLKEPRLWYHVDGEFPGRFQARRLSVMREQSSFACRVEVEGKAISVRVLPAANRRFTIEIDGQSVLAAWFALSQFESVIVCDSRSARIIRERVSETAGKNGEDRKAAILSPLPGKLLRYVVTVGEAVKPGQAVAVIESMKMEHVVEAAREAVIGELCVEPGASVKSGEEIVRLR